MFLTFFSLLLGSYLLIFIFQLATSWEKKSFGPTRSLFSLTTEKNQQIIDWKTSETWTHGLKYWAYETHPTLYKKKILWKRREVLKLKCSGRSNFNPMWRKRLIHRVLTDNVYRLELIHPVDFYWKSWFSDSINKLLASDGL